MQSVRFYCPIADVAGKSDRLFKQWYCVTVFALVSHGYAEINERTSELVAVARVAPVADDGLEVATCRWDLADGPR
jgi:hypothetical protein